MDAVTTWRCEEEGGGREGEGGGGVEGRKEEWAKVPEYIKSDWRDAQYFPQFVNVTAVRF